MVQRYRREPGDIKRFKSIKAEEYKQGVAQLRALRKEAQLTQRALAEVLKESQTYVSNVERGHRRIDIYEAERWEQVCLERIASRATPPAPEATTTAQAEGARPEPPTAPTAAGGASTSQPAGTNLPLAAELSTPLDAGAPRAAPPGEPSAVAADNRPREPAGAPPADTPPQPRNPDAPPEQPERK